jgi:hypothetical protein
MTTVKLRGYVYEVRYKWETVSTYIVSSTDGHSDDAYTFIGSVEFDYAIPATYSPTATKLAALQAKRDEAGRQFAATVKAIDEQISKLTAIGCDGVAA